MFYSANNNGFYDKEVHHSVPDDSVEITKELYDELMRGHSAGMGIGPDASGFPILVKYRETLGELSAEQYWVTSEMFVADIEINKHIDGDARAIATEAAWRAYRCQLRDYVKGGHVVGERPVRPV